MFCLLSVQVHFTNRIRIASLSHRTHLIYFFECSFSTFFLELQQIDYNSIKGDQKRRTTTTPTKYASDSVLHTPNMYESLFAMLCGTTNEKKEHFRI